MPYIQECRRENLRYGARPDNPGELNYVLTCLVQDYVLFKGAKYQHYNDAVGALECAKQELYRRRIGPYEDTKMKENGDVFV
mgnify:CR=1 FL=1